MSIRCTPSRTLCAKMEIHLQPHKMKLMARWKSQQNSFVGTTITIFIVTLATYSHKAALLFLESRNHKVLQYQGPVKQRASCSFKAQTDVTNVIAPAQCASQPKTGWNYGSSVFNVGNGEMTGCAVPKSCRKHIFSLAHSGFVTHFRYDFLVL